MGLVLRVKAGERFAVGDALIGVDHTGSEVAVHFEGSLAVIREKDLISTTEQSSAAEKLGKEVQKIYLSNSSPESYLGLLSLLASDIDHPGIPRDDFRFVIDSLSRSENLKALRHCRKMIAQEKASLQAGPGKS